MFEDWIRSSTGLPRDGEQIEFVLYGRTVAMHGTYILLAFHSHWAVYDVDRVRGWRNLGMECPLASPALHQGVRDLSSASVHAISQLPLHAAE